jgi:hypothetical protein
MPAANPTVTSIESACVCVVSCEREDSVKIHWGKGHKAVAYMHELLNNMQSELREASHTEYSSVTL